MARPLFPNRYHNNGKQLKGNGIKSGITEKECLKTFLLYKRKLDISKSTIKRHRSCYYYAIHNADKELYTKCTAHMPGRSGYTPSKQSRLNRSKSHRLLYSRISARVDIGATEYFNSLNSAGKFSIQHPNIRFKDLGYWADGFDFVLNAWFEYDTPIHLKTLAKQKDLARQLEIIEHFKSIGKPLTAFYRFNATGKGEPGLHNVLTNI